MFKYFEKIGRIFFYIFVFVLPFQTRLILAKWHYPFIEWTSAYLYVTDILVVGFLYLWLVRAVKDNLKPRFDGVGFLLLGFLVLSLLSIVHAQIPTLAWYRMLKLIEFALLFWYVRSNWGTFINPLVCGTAVAVSGILQALIAIAQYLNQSSLGLRLLGESRLDLVTPGVAVFFAYGIKYMRAYGTFTHPNVLAAWLLICLWVLIWLYLCYGKRKISFVLIGYTLILIALLLTFSRVIIAVYFVSTLLGIILMRLKEKKVIVLILLTVLISVIFAISYWPQVLARVKVSSQEDAVTERIYYSKVAGGITEKNPLLGVGIGQFIPKFITQIRHRPTHYYQPVHNIYLLISSETGIVSLLIFLFMCGLIIRGFYKKIKILSMGSLAIFSTLFSLLFIGLFDHFLWTLQQGSLMLWLLLGIVAAKSDIIKSHDHS